MTNNIKIKVTAGTYDSDLITIKNPSLELVAEVLSLLAPHAVAEQAKPETPEEAIARQLTELKDDVAHYKALAEKRQKQLDAATSDAPL